LLLSIFLSLALFTVPADRAPYVWGLRLVPLSIFTAAVFLLFAFYARPAAVRSLIETTFGFISSRLANYATGVLERFHGGLAALPDRRNFWDFVWMSVAYWGINAAGLLLLARGCNLHLSAVGAVAVMGCLAVGILLPAGPGYFGNFQVAVFAALEIYLPSSSASMEGTVFVFLYYLLQTGLTLLFGILGGIALLRRPPYRNNTAKP
jgi:hypothetical protein